MDIMNSFFIAFWPSANVKGHFWLGQKPWGVGPGTSQALMSKTRTYINIFFKPNK